MGAAAEAKKGHLMGAAAEAHADKVFGNQNKYFRLSLGTWQKQDGRPLRR